ncbi:isochorismate synthase [Gordonia polyisoprenivorans VH2]|uniref:Isochorismate synthase n=2 Tax=Gordonia polyisoprenivorans TaxID=84595 RepID=H6N1S5_GORPV|nr:chorismate-binding protein [Gordonia polyisoprenivorans]AFA73394.1 isochorismate synthase [Gordonia polyisoprenivorans VH2]
MISSPTSAEHTPDALGTATALSGTANDAHFLLCRNTYHVIGMGRSTVYRSAEAAASALRDGAVTAVVGALPFDIREQVSLIAPDRIELHHGRWIPQTVALGDHRAGRPVAQSRIVAAVPSPADHRRRIATAIDRLADPHDALAKVVLARALTVHSAVPVTGWEVAARLRTIDPRGSVFVTDLPGPTSGSLSQLVGASPEVLIRKRGNIVSAYPLAGSSARLTDSRLDAEQGRALANSTKDRTEHRFVVDALRAALAPLCRTLDVPDEPELMTTPTMWHLGTPIRGEIADPSTTALDLAMAVHPTPAICGTPTDLARDHIVATEGRRGFYAGAIGWAGAPTRGRDGTIVAGDGEWMVAIRCAEIAPGGREITTWAGGGIVADSDPDTELAETDAKFATILAALGIR